MSKGYWILHVTVTNPEQYAEYVRLDTPVVEGFGGRFLVRGGRNETPETPQKDRHVIVEFPDYETALACYHSDAYQAAARIRMANAQSDVVIIEGMS
ncbi:DUF1330 domain-containing protein [Seohaeicola zhoushanensis]|uniref:DUF1330 domain-containing protein n=1 Tax=Seohaeicola zhoushanensis TaxID=1569283 RepID=A0A8J3GUE9_9RHOB|nr:DUF1330 domain-containing protein [Seohaeicola zhoushanensis]GHF36885.1 hypothetical protein GCM10017056_05960 [Seohaeicola zhoushanensis]